MATYTYEDIRDLEGETLVGDTFDFHRPVGFYRTSTLRDITFINCTFEGDLETIDFGGLLSQEMYVQSYSTLPDQSRVLKF